MKKLSMKMILSLLIFGTFAASTYQKEETETTKPVGKAGYKIGDTATDFNLKNVDGSRVSLAGIKNAKGYIVTFTCNECPFAILYEDRLIALHEEYAPQGYPVIAINSNDSSEQAGNSFENMKVRAKEKAFPFVYLVDEDRTIYPQYGATRTPHVFLLDQDLTVQYIGAIDDNSHDAEAVKVRYVANAIDALEKGKKPTPDVTKAIGCPISAGGVAGEQRPARARGKNSRPGPPPSAKQILARMDKNKDQKISKDESEGGLRRDFDRLDENKDGYLTETELAKAGPPRRN